MGCQRRGENITGVGIDNKVQLSPRAALGGGLEPGTLPLWTRKPVLSIMMWSGPSLADTADPNVEILGASRQGGVVGDAKA